MEARIILVTGKQDTQDEREELSLEGTPQANSLPEGISDEFSLGNESHFEST